VRIDRCERANAPIATERGQPIEAGANVGVRQGAFRPGREHGNVAQSTDRTR
jgi:hypothetical protein